MRVKFYEHPEMNKSKYIQIQLALGLFSEAQNAGGNRESQRSFEATELFLRSWQCRTLLLVSMQDLGSQAACSAVTVVGLAWFVLPLPLAHLPKQTADRHCVPQCSPTQSSS